MKTIFKVGDSVVQLNPELHNAYPQWYPPVGYTGIIRMIDGTSCLVCWDGGIPGPRMPSWIGEKDILRAEDYDRVFEFVPDEEAFSDFLS